MGLLAIHKNEYKTQQINPVPFFEALDEVAQEHNITPAQAAIAWLISHPSITAPIASATNLDQLKELLAATTVELNPAAIDRLNQASA